MPRVSRGLLVGDVIALAIVVLTGFLFHGTLSVQSLPRLLWGMFVMGLAWALAAWPTGALDPDRMRRVQEWWRLLWAAVLAFPLGLVLYEFPQGQDLSWAFTRAMSTFSLSGILLWRILYWLRHR